MRVFKQLSNAPSGAGRSTYSIVPAWFPDTTPIHEGDDDEAVSVVSAGGVKTAPRETSPEVEP